MSARPWPSETPRPAADPRRSALRRAERRDRRRGWVLLAGVLGATVVVAGEHHHRAAVERAVGIDRSVTPSYRNLSCKKKLYIRGHALDSSLHDRLAVTITVPEELTPEAMDQALRYAILDGLRACDDDVTHVHVRAMGARSGTQRAGGYFGPERRSLEDIRAGRTRHVDKVDWKVHNNLSPAAFEHLSAHPAAGHVKG
jgi:hypothetical protein